MVVPVVSMWLRVAKFLRVRTRRQFRLFLRVVAIIFMTSSGYAVALLIAETKLWWSALPFAVLVISTIFEFVVADGTKFLPHAVALPAVAQLTH